MVAVTHLSSSLGAHSSWLRPGRTVCRREGHRYKNVKNPFIFIISFSNFYFNSSLLTYSLILVSGVELSDSSFAYNTGCSSSGALLHAPPPFLPSSALSLLSFSYGLFPSLSLFSPSPAHVFICFVS